MSDHESPEPVVDMPETLEPPARPWHGAENPLEALYQWVVGELARVEGKTGAAS